MLTDSEKYRLIAQINQTFTPGAPINSRDLFAGRSSQIEKAIGTVFQPGQHAVIYGERGVGKTSLANTLFDFLVFMGKHDYQRARLNCSAGMTFEEIWRSILRQLSAYVDGEDVQLDAPLVPNPHPEHIREILEMMDDPSIIIIDEFDRITDPQVHTALADTIKTLSDNIRDATLIMVGVADSLNQLIAEHRSIQRAIREIGLPRMSKAELLQIIDKGLEQCRPLSFHPDARERIADYSQGLPAITHLLAREAALIVVRSHRSFVLMEDLQAAVKESVDGQLESLLEAYRRAVSAPRGIHFRPVLLACALANKDEHGFFFASNVTAPLQYITRKPDFDIPAFARHLKVFCSEERAGILEKRGKMYRFIQPVMEPYVILRGLADELISEPQLSHPATTSSEPEQLSLLSASAGPPIDF